MSAHPVSFYERSDRALADAALRAKVHAATGRLLSGREAGFAAFPVGDAVRDEARRIRAGVVARLDEYLEQFADNVERRGGHVHWAPTAADARRIVADIAGAHGVRTAVKSKSMVSEEIELNAALERAGVRVVETDLGEWVVQLAGDHPSHIIAPIIHKSKDDVAALFRVALGATESDVADVPHMAAFARRRLRAEFLRADMGVSGGNFGVAATGSLCLVTNEGNGRLTTTVPRVHVALMGIERIVPTPADLGVMLQVLARSATGQKLSVYSNIITGPRRGRGAAEGAGAEPDGPEELHIVLVDNGRSSLVGTDLAEILYCIRCGACLNVCPVYRAIGGHAYGTVYPGPVGSVLTPALRGLDEFGALPHASSLCGACREICPVRIDLPRMLLALRARDTAAGNAPPWIRHGLWLYAQLATRPRLFRAATWIGRRLARLGADEGWIRRLPGPLHGWTDHRDFPAPAARTFTAARRLGQRIAENCKAPRRG